VSRETLQRAAELAIHYLEGVRERPVREDATMDELRAAFAIPLNDEPLPALQVVEELAAAAEPGLMSSQSPRYFGFVIGGSLESATAADWLTSAWDQNGGGYPVGPSAAIAEEVACGWLLELLGLPSGAGVGLTTGCQMAHFTGLAAARHRVLADAGWDVEADGLFGAPEIRVLLGAHAHSTVPAALRMLGLGSGRVDVVPVDGQGRMRLDELERRLAAGTGPAIVIAQLGEINTGAFDPIAGITRLCREHGAWCHVDGAFGLWAAASDTLRDDIAGHADADSWATDAHKWLNVPYDCGIAIVGDRDAQGAAMSAWQDAVYIPPPEHGEPYTSSWVPEFSRRARGFAVYAALRELGRRGVAELVERSCAHARLMARLLGGEDGVEVLNDVVLNQVLVRFRRAGENVTEDVMHGAQREGTCWMSGTSWQDEPAMRISICNWRTTEDDIRRSARAILDQARAPA
jgi:glutamate/tyrosine decarboxylase-like PLP-dependent enzyme